MQCLTCGMRDIDPLSHRHEQTTTANDQIACPECGYGWNEFSQGFHYTHCSKVAHLNHEQPRPEQAGGTTITKQSDLFPRYTFKVVTGRYKVIDNRSDSEPRVRQIATADGEDEARMIVEALNAAEQHSTLIKQRERLLKALKTTAHNAADGSGLCWCVVDDRVFGHHQKCTSIRRILNEVRASTTTGREG